MRNLIYKNRTRVRESLVILFMPLLFATGYAQHAPRVKVGIDNLRESPPAVILGKRLGLITNPTGITSDLRPTVDVLVEDSRFDLTALFGPEHGVRGDVIAGQRIRDETDSKTGLPVYSLYGNHRKPTTEMLSIVDVLLFDIQDVGIRPYTYIYTMALAMEAAKEHDIPFLVLDRPNPLAGVQVDGPVLEPDFSSFIGLYPIPYIHGMTVGELARLFNSEYGIDCELTVIPMKGWRRDMHFRDTGLLWVPTSPHVPQAETAFYIAMTGLYGELGTLSEGVGTPQPFELCGAPWIDGEKLAHRMNSAGLPGVFFRPVHFKSYYLRFENETCGGVQIHITDFRKVEPLRVEIQLLTTLRELFPEHDFLEASDRKESFNRAAGTDKLLLQIQSGWSADEIVASWQPDLDAFKKIRAKYMLYPD